MLLKDGNISENIYMKKKLPKFKVGETVQVKSEKEIDILKKFYGSGYDPTKYFDLKLKITYIEYSACFNCHIYVFGKQAVWPHYEFELKSLNKLNLSENIFKL